MDELIHNLIKGPSDIVIDNPTIEKAIAGILVTTSCVAVAASGALIYKLVKDNKPFSESIGINTPSSKNKE